MDDETAKKRLAEIMEKYTLGSVLHLLAEIFRHEAENARQADDAVVFDRCRQIEHALFVVGLGVDAANPS